MKKYILKEGNTIGKKELPGGKLEAKGKDLELKEEHVKILGNNLHHIVQAGKMIVIDPEADKKKEEEKKKEEKKKKEEVKKPKK